MNATILPPSKPAFQTRNLWPYAIIGWFAVFISATVVFVAFAARHPMALVSQSYYDEEILYQQRLDSINRTQALGATVRYQSDLNSITVSLPHSHHGQNTTGLIQLYRPSDARLDRSLPLILDASGQQQIDASTLSSGLWKVQIEWKRNDETYYFEQPLVKP